VAVTHKQISDRLTWTEDLPPHLGRPSTPLLNALFACYEDNALTASQWSLSNAIPAYSEILRNDSLVVSDWAPRAWAERVLVGLKQDTKEEIIGFLDFAPGSIHPSKKHAPFLIEAHLKWPSRYRSREWVRLSHNIATCQDLGIAAFDCVSWAIPRPELASWCAHAAIHMALDLGRNTPWRSASLGLFDIDRLARDRGGDASLLVQLGKHGHGLRPPMMVRAISSQWTRMRGHFERTRGRPAAPNSTVPDQRSLTEALCFLRSYLHSRIPVILLVRWQTWIQQAPVSAIGSDAYGKRWKSILKDAFTWGAQAAHAIVLAAYKRSDHNPLEDRFVVVDPSIAPFIELSGLQLLRCLRSYGRQNWPTSLAHSIVCLPAEVEHSLGAVRDALNGVFGHDRDIPSCIRRLVRRLAEHKPAQETYVLEPTDTFTDNWLAPFALIPTIKSTTHWKSLSTEIKTLLNTVAGKYVWVACLPSKSDSSRGPVLGKKAFLVLVRALSTYPPSSPVIGMVAWRETAGSAPSLCVRLVRGYRDICLWNLSLAS